ncbi:hypothetical protein [Actinomadura harenae]|uniref:Uncharacterized protein n=1 Tax=Actinomadura harenae TaxID=2483351 RepID=A0A3M2MCT9_9ACTN|nr:hypothetical protein [Actinomadura harenae]RMI47359.1 hypothetical protein EBO15_02235 [Actinomadura harenae]
MSESTERVVHMVGKVKNDVAMPLCHRAAAEDVISDDPARVTCRRCVEAIAAARDAEEHWLRAQEDHYGESF